MTARRRRLMLVVVGALGLVVATSALAWACTERASISLDPTSGTPGAVTTVQGKNFIEGEVDIYWDSMASSNQIAQAQATPSENSSYSEEGKRGAFSKQVTIPEDAAPGTHHMVVRSSADENGAHYSARATFEVAPAEESDSGSGEPSGSESSDGGGDTSQNTSGSPSQESSGEPSQQTSGTTSQETSGSISQETSGAGSEDRERTSEPNSVPAMGAGEEEQAGAPESSEQDSTGDAQPAPSAEERQSVGEPAPAEPAPGENRQQVGADAAEPAPSPAPSGGESPTAEADNAPASANQGAVESDFGETVFGGSVGASEDSEQAQAPEPADEGPEPVTAPSEEQSAGFSIPEAMRSGAADAAENEAPAAGSAGGDLWSGLESGETPSLTDEALADDESVSRTDGLPGALTAGVALLGLGLVTLFAGLGTAAVRRRQPAVARTRSRSQER